VDLATGLYSAIAILMALAERTRSGRGQYCDMTLHDCGMALLHPQAANFFLNGKRPAATGNAHPNISPYSKFPTATAEIFIACGNDPTFKRLCDLLGLDGLAEDERFATNADRVKNRPELDEILNARLAEEDGVELAERLLRNGVPAGPVLAVDQAMAAPHTAHRGMVIEAEGLRFLGSPIKLSRTPGVPPRRPPRFNEQAEEILLAHGFSPEEIAELAEAGVVVAERR
jgi:formyl-CoA transferase